MDENDFASLGQAKASQLTNPTTEMTKIMCNEFLKVFELKEHCKFVESDLNKYYQKIQTLTSAKSENTKLIAEYKNRNKINATNSESLLQALNELYKYKCELKSCYIATQKAFKTKKLKYKKIISSYESEWEKALKQYTADPVVVELREIEQENTLLQQNIEKQEKLAASTKIQFIQLKENSEKTFLEKIINFSKAVVEYNNFLKSINVNKQSESHQESRGHLEFTLFRPGMQPCNKKEAFSPISNDDANYSCSIDVSVFDDIMVPSENLESQNLEEDAFFGQNDERQLSEVSKDNEEGLECSKNYQQTGGLQCKAPVQASNEFSAQDDGKAKASVNENESQYFRTNALECLKQNQDENIQGMEHWNPSTKNIKKQKNNLNGAAKPLERVESDDEASKDVHMESEESLSETSYEKQFGNQREENYECQYKKTSSISSDDLPAENLNEYPSSSRLFGEQKTDVKPGQQSKDNEIKSFTGFFTMGSDQDTSKPSIFKLF